MTITAFIFARSGSKRIPNKNIKNFAGKPLIAWTIQKCISIKKVPVKRHFGPKPTAQSCSVVATMEAGRLLQANRLVVLRHGREISITRNRKL